MFGPHILVRSLAVPSVTDKQGRDWQYHSRSDRHSKVACWGVLFDLLLQSPVLRDHVDKGEVMFGINHQMNDWSTRRKKNLDLVLCQPGHGKAKGRHSFKDLAADYAIALTAAEQKELDDLPDIEQGPVGPVFVALEAKAAMTAHVKALPRLYDELNSSHLTIHGDTEEAIAAGFVMVNLADSFVSPGMNKEVGAADVITLHKQPQDALRVIEKIREIPRRSSQGAHGFDALAVLVLRMPNDGGPVDLVEEPPALAPSDHLHYEQAIQRMAHLYEVRRRRA